MKNKTSLNIVCSTLSQLVSIVSGLIVPRLLLSTFGSEANGLVSSLNQFLNYIALFEGGLGAVVLSALYHPLSKKDNSGICGVLSAANRFFRQIAFIFLGYVVVIAVVYPLVVESSFSWFYVFSLTFILAVGLFIQYFFSVTYKLLLQADHKMYIVQLVQICASIMNLILVCVSIKCFPQMHVVKLFSALIYVVQPLAFDWYVRKHYDIRYDVQPDQKAMSQRWACFGQNLAYFIHNNTDTVILTFFTTLKLVSVYSVHNLVITHLMSFFKSFSHAFAPMIGKSIAKGELEEASRILGRYEFIVVNIATVIFGCCMCLLPDFVLLYTKGVTDANYYQPVFCVIIVLAQFFYCIRTPYNDVIYSAGKFKETEKSGYLEAILNIVTSLLLVRSLGLVGIAIGTLLAMASRMLYFVYFLKKNVLFRSIWIFVQRMIICTAVMVTAYLVYQFVRPDLELTLFHWVINGFICFIVYGICTVLMNFLFDRKTVLSVVIKK